MSTSPGMKVYTVIARNKASGEMLVDIQTPSNIKDSDHEIHKTCTVRRAVPGCLRYVEVSATLDGRHQGLLRQKAIYATGTRVLLVWGKHLLQRLLTVHL